MDYHLIFLLYDIMQYTLVFIVGIVIGSFLNVCIFRIPEGKSIVMPSSACMECNTKLKFYDLIPVFSYLFLKGKCRYCGTKISPRYPITELITGGAFVLLFFRYGVSVEFAAFAFLTSILIAVLFIDLDHYIIPDGLVLTGLAGGVPLILYNIFYPFEIYHDRSWWNPLVGLFCASGVLLVVGLIGTWLLKAEAMGMGDIKILAPIGVFLGWKMAFMALFLSIMIGGLASFIFLALKKKGMKDGIPFGPYIVAGTFITMIWGWDILNWYLSHFVFRT